MTDSNHHPPLSNKVPVMDHILPLYAHVLGQPGLLLRLTGMLLVILVAVDILVQTYFRDFTLPELQRGMQQGSLAVWGPLLAQMVAYVWVSTMYAVRWHRYMLLGQQEYGFADVAPRGRDWRYFGMGLAIGFLIGIVVGILSVVAVSMGPGGVLVILGIGLLAAYVCGRISLIFPGIAVESGMSLGGSWRHTEGNGWRIVLLFLVMAMPVGLVAQFVPAVVPLSIPELPLFSALIRSVVMNFFMLITVALGQSALSHAYKHLVPRGTV